jgi:hypothetical protein
VCVCVCACIRHISHLSNLLVPPTLRSQTIAIMRTNAKLKKQIGKIALQYQMKEKRKRKKKR